MIKTNCALARRYGKHLQWYIVKNLKLLTVGRRGRTIKKSLEWQHLVRPQSIPPTTPSPNWAQRANPMSWLIPTSETSLDWDTLTNSPIWNISPQKGLLFHVCLPWRPSVSSKLSPTCGKINHKYVIKKVRGKSRKHQCEGASFKKSDKRRFPGEIIRQARCLPDIFGLPWQLLQIVLQCTCSWWGPCRWWFLGNKPHYKNKRKDFL